MSELRPIARHAATVLTGQLAVMAFGVADTLVAGRHSPQSLAALAVGSAVFISVFVALTGVLQALLPLWAELEGAGQPKALGRSVRQGLYMVGALCALGMALLLVSGPALEWTQVPVALRPDVRRYLGVLALAVPPTLLFRLFSTFNQAIHQPRVVTVLQVAALAIKVPLSMWWTWGGWGWPAMGATGCAMATAVVYWILLGLALRVLRERSLYAPYELWRWPEPPQARALKAFIRLGVPAGLAVMVEVTSFTLMALFISRLGTTAVGAHQIASNIAAVLYMVPLSIGIATSARTSQWLGAGQPRRAQACVLTGLSLSTLCGLSLSGLLLLGHANLPKLYTAAPLVIDTAAPLLIWVAFYHLADTIQAVCVFVLRCYQVSVATLVVYSALLWGGGLGGGYALAYHDWNGHDAWGSANAFWASSTFALAAAAVAFLLILHRQMRLKTP
jgi:MATE family multidrug resistance protein